MNPIIHEKVPYCVGNETCPRYNKPGLCWAFRPSDICKTAVENMFDKLVTKPLTDKKKDVCLWVHEGGFLGLFTTSCGHEFAFDSGTPRENKFKICPFCGNDLATY